MSKPLDQSTLFYGDNLAVLRSYIPDNSIDLIYLDPPFNSKADYNILFREASGEDSTAQIQAFSDSWHWDVEAKRAYDALVRDSPGRVSDLMVSLHGFLGRNDMMAYLVMMGERLLELHGKLKPTGSIFLHCDTTASHYLRLIMDSIYGGENFRNEIIWKRVTGHSDARRFGRISDRILFYSKTDEYKFIKQSRPRSEDYLKAKFKKDETGRLYRLDNLNPPGGRGPVYEFHGITRPWRFTQEKMLKLELEGKIYTKSKIPQLVRYLDEMGVGGGSALPEIWDDIPPINSQAKERLGFPTQKPTALLERIINATTEEGDWVMDPFCGCGTAVVAAEKLHRRWIGIDITYLAINLVKGRITDAFPDAVFNVEGEPRDLGAARALAQDRYQFQWWALSLVNARPVGSTDAAPRRGKKGADEGVDGWIRFADGLEGHYQKVVVQVKSGHVGVKDIRELRDTVSRQKASVGVFVTLEEPTSEMTREAKASDPFKSRWGQEYPSIQILTVEDLLRGTRPRLPPTERPYQEAEKTRRENNNSKGSRTDLDKWTSNSSG